MLNLLKMGVWYPKIEMIKHDGFKTIKTTGRFNFSYKWYEVY